jgi:2,3-bisphosphoglycerate-independent phosphoglycerate mutase
MPQESRIIEMTHAFETSLSKNQTSEIPKRRSALFLFMDGVGLGANDPAINPFAATEMPNLQNLLGGERLLLEAIPKDKSQLVTQRATLVALDACMGVPGSPQSATGQAALLTGQNVPAQLGYHYGPKPNQAVASFLRNGSLFRILKNNLYLVALLNAYPPRYFHAIESGRRLYSAIPLAVTSAGIPLRTQSDLVNGQALSADFTAEGWRTQLGFPDIPQLEPEQAGTSLARLAQELDFAMFEYWLSDYAGHGQNMNQACQLLETFDRVLGGLLAAWDDRHGLILITSDHGNLEDLSTRHHTRNYVPALIVGDSKDRQIFIDKLHNLAGISPAIQRYLQADI